MPSTKPILVTGSPRSGTSWVGRIIEQVPFIRYIHEPFNITGQPCQCGVHFPYWFYHVSPRNSHEYDDHLKHVMYPAYKAVGLLNLIKEMVQSRRVRPLLKYLRAYRFHKVLVKDPLAVFSAETLACLFDMDVIVVIRHPAAVVSSYKALNWTVPFSHFLNQPELMEEHLSPFRAEIEDFAKKEYDIVDQVALLWKLIHYMILNYENTHPDWIYVRFEDLASDPMYGFQSLFNRLDLPFAEHIQTAIRTHSLKAPVSETIPPYAVKKNSAQVINKWKKSLFPTEINRIRKRVEEVSSHFFSHNEWCIVLPFLFVF